MASDYCKLGSAIIGESGLSFRSQAKTFKTYFSVNSRTYFLMHEKIKREFRVVAHKKHLL